MSKQRAAQHDHHIFFIEMGQPRPVVTLPKIELRFGPHIIHLFVENTPLFGRASQTRNSTKKILLVTIINNVSIILGLVRFLEKTPAVSHKFCGPHGPELYRHCKVIYRRVCVWIMPVEEIIGIGLGVWRIVRLGKWRY